MDAQVFVGLILDHLHRKYLAVVGSEPATGNLAGWLEMWAEEAGVTMAPGSADNLVREWRRSRQEA